MKYANTMSTAQQILTASGVKQEQDGTYYFILGGRLSFYELNADKAEQLINETLALSAIDYYDPDSESEDGTIEVKGVQIFIEYA